MLALNIRQPAAWCVLHAGQDIYNSDWAWPAGIALPKRILIYADPTLTGYDYSTAAIGLRLGHSVALPLRSDLAVGAIVGAVTLVACHYETHSSPWFSGPFGFELARPSPLRSPIPCEGRRSLWTVTADIERAVRDAAKERAA